MTFSIFDTGNLVVSFDREDAAYEALERLASEAPEMDDRLLLLVAFDDDGNVVDDCVPGEHLAAVHAA